MTPATCCARSTSGSPATAGSPSRSPRGLAHDTDATAAEAGHLWWLVDRPNLFIKIPATEAGLPAITETIANGHQRQRHADLQPRALPGGHGRLPRRPREAAWPRAARPSTASHSVASFFVSRVDTEIDKRLDEPGARRLAQGKAGIANAQLAYQAYEEVFSSDRWRALEAKGAVPQRPLWASTGVKNPEYCDTMYISELIAPGTVNTMPEKTMHGLRRPRHARARRCRRATTTPRAVMQAVADAGVDLDDVFRVLEDEGVQKFVDSWDELTDRSQRARGQEGLSSRQPPTHDRRPVRRRAGRRFLPDLEDGP